MSLRRQSVRDTFRGTASRKRRTSQSLSESTDLPPFSKDITNTIGADAKPTLHAVKPVPVSTQSVVPFPVCPPSPQKALSKLPWCGAQFACPSTEAKRRLLKDSLARCNTAVIASTLNSETLSVHDFGGTILHPQLLLESLRDESTSYHAWVAVKSVIDSGIGDSGTKLTKAAMEQFLIELGKECIDHVPGPHLTFTDARMHNNSAAIIRQARRLITRFEKAGVDRSKVVLSIPATPEGVLAAKELETLSIQTNLILVSSLMHAAVCAEAKATTATIHVGTSVDWFDRTSKTREMLAHPAIEDIQSILEYFRTNKIQTKLIGSDFRSIAEISRLGRGFDAISLSEAQITEWRTSNLALSGGPPQSSAVFLRARQAQFPTSFLTSKGGFMAAMSASTRSMVTATLKLNLRKMAGFMNQLEAVIADEVERQLGVAGVDITTLYRHWRMQMRACPFPLRPDAPAFGEYQDEPEPDWFLDSYGREIREILASEDLEEIWNLRASQQLKYQDEVAEEG